MNEEALQEAFRLFASQGYNGDINKFVNLVSTNQDALQEAHRLFASQGYNGDINKFKTLIGVGQQQPTQQPEQQPVVQPTVKKKDDTESSWWSGDGISESEPSKTEPKTDLFGINQKVFGVKQPQQEQVDPIKRPETVEAASGTWGSRAKKEQPLSEPLSDFMQVYGQKKGEGVLAPTKPLDFVGRMTPELVKERTPKFLEEGLESLTPSQFWQFGAKGAKETFEYYFKDAGFKFEADGNNVKAISPSGEIYEYNTKLAAYPNNEMIDEFKNFVRESAFKNPEIADKAYLYEKENKKFKTKEDISNEVKAINAQEEGFMGDYKKFLNLKRDIDEIEADLKRWRDSGEQNTPKYIQTEAYLNERKKEFEQYGGTIKEKAVGLEAQQAQLNKAVGKYTEFQATQGDFGGTLYRAVAETSANIFSQFLRTAVSKSIDFMPLSSVMGKETYQDALNKKLKEKGYGDDKVVPIDVLKEAKAEIEAEMGAEARNDYKVAARTGKYKGEQLNNVLTINDVRESLKDVLTAPVSTTSEYKQKREEEGGFVERGLIGLAGSLPAMIGGKYVRYMNMFMMTTDAVMQEMDNNPNFAGISENEKELVALPIGVVGAALEEIGLRGLIKGSSITTNIVRTVIGRVPAGASASAIRKTTFDVVAEMGIRGTLALTGATLSEAETGAAQQINEYFVKDIYNSMREKKMFDNPAFLSGQYLYDVYDAARTEAVGGFVMGVPYSVSAAYKKDGFQALDDATFKIFEDLAKDDNGRKFFVTSLKNRINQGTVTPEQGKQMIEAYDQASGMIGMVPDEITDPESRKVAMDLMSERKKLEKQKYGKDEALAKPIQNKIDKINEQLTQLTEDAIQKQAASEVSLQPEAGAGQEVEVGGPEAKPKITPEESKRKEALIAALEETKRQEDETGKESNYTKVNGISNLKSAAQEELDAIIAKEQGAVTEQGGMEQAAPAEGIGTQLEMAAKEEETPAEVTPAPKTTTDIITSAPIEIKGGVVVTDSDGNDVMVNGNEQVAAKLYDEAMAIPEEQRTPNQNDIVEKVQRIISQAAAEVAPVAEVALATTPVVEETPAEVVEKTPEQEADLLEELMTGKKKEPVAVAPAIETVVEAKEEEVVPEVVQTTEGVGSNQYKANSKTHVTGRQRERTIADGTKIKGRYKLVSADDVLASHNEENFGKTEGFPVNEQGKTVNDRDYETDKAAQSEVVRIAGKLDERALSQTPIVTKDGIVVDGNNRTMSRKLAAKQGTDQAYLEALRQDADMYGIDPNEIDNVKNPMLIFEADQKIPYTTKEFGRFNKAEKKEKSPIEKAVELSKTITDRARQLLGGIYERAERPSDVTSSAKNMSDIRDLLLAEGILQPNELPRYINPETGTATKEGVAFLETLLIGSALNENVIRALDSEGMGAAKMRVMESVVQITQNAALGDNSLQSNIENGIKLLNKATQGGISVVDTILQMELFETSEYSAEDLAVAILLDGKGFKAFLNKYNSEVGTEGFFGSITKEGLIDELLNNKIKGYEQIRENLRPDAKAGQTEVQKGDGGVKPESEGKQGATTKEEIAKRIRGKKNKGLMSSIDFGISQALYNGALEFMASQVEKDTKLGNAIANTIKWIDERMQGKKWNKGAFGKYMNDTYKVTLGDGRQVDVLRDDSKETADVINGWYQPIEQKIIDSKQDKQPANKWAEQLRSKEDEDLWTGVREFLESKGNQSVSKKELLDFMKNNRVEIVEVVKTDDTKYSRYQLPGDKSDYKEVLITIPSKGEKPLKKWDFYKQKGYTEEQFYALPREQKQKLFEEWTKERDKIFSKNLGIDFRSSHFNEPNILVHLRMNTRTDADGNKVLFLEEVQSDWGQEGKKIGFKDNKDDKILNDLQEKVDKKKAEISELQNQLNNLTPLSKEEENDLIGEKGKLERQLETVRNNKDYNEINNRIDEINKELNNYEKQKSDLIDKISDLKYIGSNSLSGLQSNLDVYILNNSISSIRTPNAPFVTDTNSWVKLGLKMALREAAAQGADKIAWTTGEQQNERYDLSKQIEKISYDKSDNTITAWNKDGKQVIQQTAKESELPNIIGKDVADKLLNQKEDEEGVVELSGQDIKVGGKGMKGFYDGIVPNVAKALVKEVTGQEGKITEVNIEGNTQQAIDVTLEIKTQAKTALPLFSGKLSDTIRGLEIKGPGGLQSNIFGIPIAIWNAAVKTTAAAIDANVAVAEALQRGAAKIKNWIKENDPFNKLTDERINNKVLRETFAGAVKIARDNNVSEEGIKTYLKRKGLTDEQIEVVVKKRESKPATTQAEVKEKTTAKKVDVSDIKELEQIVKLQEDAINAGKTSVTEAVKEFIRLFNKSKVITKLTRSDLNKIINLMGKVSDYKSLQTATGKMFDIILKSNPDLIEVSKTKLIEEFKKKVKAGIREGKKDLNTKRKELTAAIKEMKKKGSISVRQAKALINRVNAVNLDNPVMVERLLTYAENIFNDADYDTRIQEVRKLQDKVKKVNHVSMRDTVREFASINPERIPADKLLDYIQALDDMSTRTPFYQKMNDMFDEVMSYKSESKEFDAIKTFQALIDKLESIAINQVKSVEDYVALIRDINSFKRKAYQLLENGDITQEQYDQAIENVGKDQSAVEKKYEKELAALKEKLVQEIMELKPEVHPDFTPEETVLINKYLELSESDLESLSPEDLYVLNDLLNNIKEDTQLDYYRLSEIVSKAYTNAGGQKLAEQLNESKFDKTSDEGKKLLLEQESAFWEGLLGLGRATSGALQKFIVSPFNRAIASFENFMKDGYSEFLKLKSKYRMKDYNMHRLGIFTTYLQEYMAQFDPANKNVKDIGKRDWFGEIISNEGMRDGYKSAKPSAARLIGMGDADLKTIEKIYNSLPKDANGKVDPKAVYDSFMANDGKFFTKQEKAFFDKIMEWKQKNLTTKQKAANEMSGMPFKEIPFHMMRVRLDQGAKQISPKAEGGAGKVRIEAGTGKERSSQKVGPIMTNFEQLFTENLEQTARNYYLREAINDINNTLSVAKKGLDKNKIGLFNTIPGAISEALNFEFDKTESQFLAGYLLAARAAETLFTPIRTAVELTSAFLSYPFRAKTPKGYRELFGKQGKMKKLLDFTGSPIRLRDNINKAIDISDGRIKPLGKFEKAVNYLSGLPERTMLITSWMPTFNNEFKDIIGEKFDMDEFNSSAEYRQKYGKAIKEAAAVADAQTEKIIGSTTKAGGRREIRIAPKILANVFGLEGTVKKNTSAGQILGFFSNYPYREVTEFLNGFREAAEVYKQGGGAIKSVSQLQKPLGVVINLAAYGFLSSVVYAMKLMLLGDDDDEEKGEGMLKELMTPKGFMEELQGNAISLGASKYAAGGKAMLQMFATIAYNSTSDKEQKARIKKILKNSVFIEPIDAEKVQGYGGKNELLGAISSYVPQAVLLAKRIEETIQTAGELNYIYKKFQDGGLNALSEDEGLAILAIDGLLKTTQTIFNFKGTSLPMYNDIKMYMKGAKKEAGVGNIKLTATENKHKKALQNYKNEKEFKENDPDGYLKAIDEGGSLYEYKKEQSKKEEEANKDEPFRGMSEEAFKKNNPKKWREKYGPGTKYYYEQRTPAARKKRAEMRRVEAEAKRIKKRNERDKEE